MVKAVAVVKRICSGDVEAKEVYPYLQQSCHTHILSSEILDNSASNSSIVGRAVFISFGRFSVIRYSASPIGLFMSFSVYFASTLSFDLHNLLKVGLFHVSITAER